jgi:hypothetical protein
MSQVADVIKLEDVQCASQISEFTTSVSVELPGNAQLSFEEEQALEQGFKQTYNGLSEVQCDPFFRRVRTAT